jgi:hypothetical protein
MSFFYAKKGMKKMSQSNFTLKGALEKVTKCTINKFAGSSAIAETITTPLSGNKWVIDEIRIHLSANGDAENLTVDVDSNSGSAYDFNFLTQSMSSISDLRYVPDGDKIVFEADDEVDIAYTNTSSRTYGLEVITRAVY